MLLDGAQRQSTDMDIMLLDKGDMAIVTIRVRIIDLLILIRGGQLFIQIRMNLFDFLGSLTTPVIKLSIMVI